MNDKQTLLRNIPQIDEMLQNERLVLLMEKVPRPLVVETVREVIDGMRQEILAGELEDTEPDELVDAIATLVEEKEKKSLQRVVNATGVVLHTNLGRANLCEEACNQIVEAAGHYSNLEYDVKKGARGSRHDHVEKIICKITGAEAAMVVNNNAAATMLCLSAMAKGQEVIVSRGELVEIGGSFRVPDIMEESGCHLKEVGTTNKTKISDYKNAFQPEETGALMKVHTSNYRIVGFTQDASLEELVALGKELELPVIYDMGSGLLVDLSKYGVEEPTVLAALATGIDVILFSGDKLLGGPQLGVLAGSKKWIDRMKSHPLARAFRVDKMSLAAAEATFHTYLDPEEAKKKIPVLKMITLSKKELKLRAEQLKLLLEKVAPDFIYEVEKSEEKVGGGSAPTSILNGYAVSVTGDLKAEKLERMLRKNSIPIITRVGHNKLFLNVRTIQAEEVMFIVHAFEKIAGK
ncbi:MAG: L-seryl-tRNA(Sec) selenium transferase [Lachnospiraceae bacterium]